ncbi:ATP-grasp domain-containing protein [Nocardiopsis sp. ARC36]
MFVEGNTTGTGMLALRRATGLGLRPVFVTSLPSRYAGLEETGCEVVVCDTNDAGELRAAVLDRFRLEELAGVMTTSDFYVRTAAGLAAELGLAGNGVGTVEICRDKAALRALANGQAPRTVRSVLVGEAGELAPALAEIGLPCVLKPVDDSGSSGVRLCRSKEEARAHADGLLARRRNGRGQPSSGAVLVEELLEGPEYSVEMFTAGGEHRLVGVTEKHLAGSPHFVEAMHVFPAPLAEDVRDLLAAEVRRVLTAVGVEVGPPTPRCA